jgi:hypothetical protein
MVRFSYRMVPEVYQVFWAGMAAGEFINDAAIAASSAIASKAPADWLRWEDGMLGDAFAPKASQAAVPVAAVRQAP